MITPADLARMLRHNANSADSHAQISESKDLDGVPNHHLLYSVGEVAEPLLHDQDLISEYPDKRDDEDDVPTPALMPRHKSSAGLTTFASLDAQELPVVREYSAGGLIFDRHERVAIIARHSRSGHLEWCLPKGHIEKGETPEETAVREVHEETGILGQVTDSIATIDYWFTGNNQRVHKLVHHFVLEMIGGSLSVEGDPDHEAEDAIWVDFSDLSSVLSYPNERKIAWLYARKYKKQL